MIQVGMVLEAHTLSPITREQLRAYADASGDFNPIHLDEEVAKRSGLPGVIAHGMLVAGFMSERVKQVLSQDREAQKMKWVKTQTRFRAMTLLGDTLTLQVNVKDSSLDALTLEVQTKNQRSELVATSTVWLKSDQ